MTNCQKRKLLNRKFKIGDFVKPVDEDAKWVLDKTVYLVEGYREYNKNSKMIKLKGHTLYFNEDDFELVKK